MRSTWRMVRWRAVPDAIRRDDRDNGQEGEPTTPIIMDDHELEVNDALCESENDESAVSPRAERQGKAPADEFATGGAEEIVMGEPTRGEGQGKAPELSKSQFRVSSGCFHGNGLGVDIEDIVDSGNCFHPGTYQRVTRSEAPARKSKKVTFDLVDDGS